MWVLVCGCKCECVEGERCVDVRKYCSWLGPRDCFWIGNISIANSDKK